jgi:hypothetical protein
MEPHDRIGLANLTRWAFEGIDLTPLRQELLTRCAMDRDSDGCFMDLSVIDQLQGQREAGLAWQDRALQRQRVFRTNHRDAQVEAGRKRLLVLARPSHMGGNTPIEFLLQDSRFEILTYYPDFTPGEADRLPDHDVAFCAVPTDAEGAEGYFDHLRQLADAAGRPVLNLPAGRVDLDRDALAGIFPYVPGLRIPATRRIGRDRLQAALACGEELSILAPLGGYPVIARPVGSHAGAGLARLDGRAALCAYLEREVAAELFLSEYVDYASADDGLFRKYRIVFVDGIAYPVHMAIADRWDIWYLNAGMEASAPKRAEEAAFMHGFDQGFAHRHRRSFEALSAGIGLDYFGIDCAEDARGNLVLFEADNALIVHDMDSKQLFPYKGAHMRRIFEGFQQMLLDRCDPQAGPGAFSGPGGLQPATHRTQGRVPV